MRKKTMIIIAAVVVLLAVVSVVMLMQSPGVDMSNATVRNISENNHSIACDDATWLLDKYFEMIDEKLAQLGGIESVDGELTEEQYREMQNIMYNTPGAAQKEIDQWYMEVIEGIAKLERNQTRQQELFDIIGNEYLQIYQAAMATRLGLMDESEVRAALAENFCGM